MIGVGALRLAVEGWSGNGGARPPTEHLAELVAAMPEVLGRDAA